MSATGGATDVENVIVAKSAGSGFINYGATVDYCDSYDNHSTDSGFDGAHDLTVDPKFTDAASGDFTLSSFTSCVDAGNPAKGYDDTDGSTSDLGAFAGPYGAWTPM